MFDENSNFDLKFITMKKFLIIVFIIIPIFIFAQPKQRIEIPMYTNVLQADGGYFMNGIEIDGEIYPYIKLYKIVIFPERKFKNKRQKKRYDKLTFNVKKVYPYAVIIGNFYREIEQDLAHIPGKRDQKKYVKTKEKELRAEFEEALVNLTFTQGRLLIKLVDRQTDHTTFEVVEQFKGEMNAYFWQSIARIFGSNLKTEYDKNEEDKMIEEIIAKIENGQI